MFDSPTPRFIYFESPNWWDLLTITIYGAITYLIFWNPNLFQFQNLNDWGIWYATGTHLFLYFFNYKSLRKFNIWLVWLLIAFLHLLIEHKFGSEPNFQLLRGSGIKGLKFTWFLLLLIQGFRYFSLERCKVEFVALGRSSYDLWDDRRTNRLDSVFFLVYFPTAVLINVSY